jgi:hypothetical protein
MGHDFLHLHFEPGGVCMEYVEDLIEDMAQAAAPDSAVSPQVDYRI